MRRLVLLLILSLTALSGCASRDDEEALILEWEPIAAEDFPYVLKAPGLEDPVGLYQRADERFGRYKVIFVRGTWRPPYQSYPVAGLQVSASGGVLLRSPRIDTRLNEQILEYLGEREWRMVYPGRSRNRFGPVDYARIVAEEADECVFFAQSWTGKRSLYMIDGFYCVPLEVGLSEDLVEAVLQGVDEKRD